MTKSNQLLQWVVKESLMTKYLKTPSCTRQHD